MPAKAILRDYVSKIVAIDEDKFERFYAQFELQAYKKGETIIKEGRPVGCEYFVISGCLKSYQVKPDLRMLILQFSLPTWWVSDFEALYSGGKASITVDCITDAEVLCISNEAREEICKEFAEIAYFFRWRTNRGYVAMQKRVLSLMNNDTKVRYEELLNQYPALYALVPKQLIAAYLGVSRETLSRLYRSDKKSQRTGRALK